MKAAKTCAKLAGKTKECPWIAPLTCQKNKDHEKYLSVSQDSGVDCLKDSSPDISRSSESGDLPEYIVETSTNTTYLKGKFLGKGGFAKVHEVTDLTTNIVYAGKIIPKNRITKPHHRQKIFKEIEIHSHLNHRNVVRFNRFFEDTNNVYIILENCPRKSLVHVLHHRKTLTEPEVKYYLYQLIEGMDYIHSQQIIHRDLKLGNMFLSEDMLVKLGDFGLACKIKNDNHVSSICGTPNYIAPEVLNKQGYSLKTDIWAIGCIMYAMLIGQPPFETNSLNETYYRIKNNKYILSPLISESAKSLIRLLLHPSPSMRPSSIDILEHSFFTLSSIPCSLPVSSCYGPPNISKYHSESQRCSNSCHSFRNSMKLSDVASSLVTLEIVTSRMVGIGRNMTAAENTWSKDLSTVHLVVSRCVQLISKKPVCKNPPCLTTTPVFITKWIDYSNKFGFGFEISNKKIGVIFNDTSKINFNSERNLLEYRDSIGKLAIYPVNSVPQAIASQYNFLAYVAQYLDENLTDGGNMDQVLTANAQCNLHMRHWKRWDAFIVMQLTNGNFQMNFPDHSKVIFSMHDVYGLLLSVIRTDRTIETYRMTRIVEDGCDDYVRTAMKRCLSILRDGKRKMVQVHLNNKRKEVECHSSSRKLCCHFVH